MKSLIIENIFFINLLMVTFLPLIFISFLIGIRKGTATLGSFNSFFKEDKIYILRGEIGNNETEKIYIFQKVKKKRRGVIYSRKYYLKKNVGIKIEGLKAGVILEVENIERTSVSKYPLSITFSIFKVETPRNVPRVNLNI